MTTAPDWRENIMRDLPEAPISMYGQSFASAREIIEIAAYNRRISLADFVGRAALAVAVFDSEGEITWEQATEKEPPIRDRRLRKLRRRRLRGKGFGPWKITGMSE